MPYVTTNINGFNVNLDRSEAIQAAMYDGTYEPEQTAWVRELLRPGDRFVDIGASFGHYVGLASRLVGPSGRVLAFEPSPYPASAVAEMIEANGITNVDLFCCAVGDQDGSLMLQLPKSGPVHSPSVFSPGPDFAPFNVGVVRPDTFVPLTGARIDIMKIDVEGFEPNVIRGLSGLARPGMIHRLLCEFNSGWLGQNAGANAGTLYDQIVALGFKEVKSTEKSQHLGSDGITYELQDILFQWG